MATGWARFAHRFGQYYQHAPLWSPPRIKTRSGCSFPSGRTAASTQVVLGHRPGPILPLAASHAFMLLLNGVLAASVRIEDGGETLAGADLIFDLDGDHLPGV